MLTEATSNPAAIVVVDADFPGIGGLAVCRQLAGHPAPSGHHDSPVILRLSADDPSLARLALEAGALHCMAAATSVREIYLKVRNYLRTTGRSHWTASLPCVRSGLRPGQCLMDALPEPIAITDANHTVVDVNAALAKLAGQHKDSLHGLSLADLLKSLHITDDLSVMMKQLNTEHALRGEVHRQTSVREPQAFSLRADTLGQQGSGTSGHHIVLLSDITHRMADEHRLRTQAETDALTGVANRNLFTARLSDAIAQAQNVGESATVLFIDLDGFKNVNDHFGHAQGDQTLCEVGRVLSACVRSGDTVARLGGDEFAVLLIGASRAAQEDTVKRILDSLVFVFVRDDGLRIEVSCSIGVATVPGDGTDVTSIMKQADKAMYTVKRRGKKGYCFAGEASFIN